MNTKHGLENKKTANLIGQKFHLLTVLKVSELKGEKGRLLWDCQCDCGQIKSGVKSYDLKRAAVKSCGCHVRGKNNSSWRGHEEISGRYWASLQKAAQDRNIPFNISIKEAWDLFLKQDRKCALTGSDLGFSPTTRDHSGTASIDRIDSKKPYDLDNIQWVHKWVNVMKWDLTTEEFVEICRKVVEKSCKK